MARLQAIEAILTVKGSIPAGVAFCLMEMRRPAVLP